jgi:hypothetical protein
MYSIAKYRFASESEFTKKACFSLVNVKPASAESNSAFHFLDNLYLRAMLIKKILSINEMPWVLIPGL